MSTFINAVGKHIERMGGLEGRVDSVTIYPKAPEDSGWLEWLLVYQFADGGKMTVGMIQREPNGNVEFHT